MNTETKTTGNELLELVESGKDITLQNIKSGRIYDNGWKDWDYQLNEMDVIGIATLLGGWEKTQNLVANKLRSLSTLPSHWAFDRIHFCKHSKRWAYTAGQDYPSELATIRKWFTNL